MMPHSSLSLDPIEAIVRDRVGFDLQSLGEQNLRRAVSARLATLRIPDTGAYAKRLSCDHTEFETLVEALLVPETWFFRDRVPFRCLQHYVSCCWRPSSLNERLRILSIPCSSGEEPYSIAMTLLDLGMPTSQFEIDAVDLSRQALQRTAEGVYRASSFRGDEAVFPELRDRFLQRDGEVYRITDPLRVTVRPVYANLASPELLAGQRGYHVIFCRNVLIYLHAQARRTALSSLHRLLLPSGLLYVGHVEAAIVKSGKFQTFSREYPFAFHPAPVSDSAVFPRTASLSDASASRRANRPGPGASHRPAARRPAERASQAASSAIATPTPLAILPPTMPVSDRPFAGAAETGGTSRESVASTPGRLTAARDAADAGRLEETAAICQEILKQDPAHADALLLMALVLQTRGELAAAEALFQKVLYLHPAHEEALVHMMLLAQRRGDEQSAANFRRRAQQAQRKESPR